MQSTMSKHKVFNLCGIKRNIATLFILTVSRGFIPICIEAKPTCGHGISPEHSGCFQDISSVFNENKWLI